MNSLGVAYIIWFFAGMFGTSDPIASPGNFFAWFVGAATLSRSLRFFLLSYLMKVFGPRVTPIIEKYFNWLSLLLTYLLEALLADPVYGGNPGGIGWQWLAHQPGFPTPPADKTWYKLAAPVHYQRKA